MMKNWHAALCTFAMLALALALALAPAARAEQQSAPAAKLDDATTQKIDTLFAAWDKPSTPGAALAIVKDGKVVYRRGYGMADVEHDAPNTPATPYHQASISKQFTAFAIYLLAQDGKLAIDDDVRKYLPELHDFGTTITIRHLLNHTSGLRDQWSLLALAGWRLEDVITEDDVLDLVWRQRALNFAPGTEYVYCNTGYTLLGLIVKRVAGMPLPAFAQQRIFKPLGMQNTHFHDNYGVLVKGRATSYVRASDGYRHIALSYSNVGATSLFSTADDLALWDQNFYDGKVGGKELLAHMQVKGKLTSGKEIVYASGLIVDTYDGRNTIDHGGSDAGFRTDLLRFPDQHFSVVILANAGNMNPGALAKKIADIYFGKEVKAVAAVVEPVPAEVKINPAALDAFVGDYEMVPGFVLSFTKENGQLMVQATGQEKFPLFASSDKDFFLKVVDARFTFDAPGKDGVVAGGTLHQNGRDQHAVRVGKRVFAGDLKDKTGEFYSDELHTLYAVTLRDGKLRLRFARGELDMAQSGDNTFSSQSPVGQVAYQCSAGKPCSGFTLTDGRVRNLQFTRVSLMPQGAN